MLCVLCYEGLYVPEPPTPDSGQFSCSNFESFLDLATLATFIKYINFNNKFSLFAKPFR